MVAAEHHCKKDKQQATKNAPASKHTVESCQSRHYQTMLNCSLFIHALAKWLDITSFDAEMIALCLDGKSTLISLTIILINTLEAGSHTTALARFYSM